MMLKTATAVLKQQTSLNFNNVLNLAYA
ncbi:protein of unknown function [Latilactobacillus sakei]|nr:protein of unknown function [Latilactobacillus sakei]